MRRRIRLTVWMLPAILAATIRPAKHTWHSAVQVTPDLWSAEIAIPVETGKGLRIFLESFNRSGVGPERTFYKFRSWRRWFVTGGEANLSGLEIAEE